MLAILAVYAIVGVWLIADGAPLGHDESVYALKSRQMHSGGTSLWYWNDYRAPGLPLLLQVTWLISGTEPFLRASVWALGAAGVTLTWMIGRSLFDTRSGLIAAGGLAMASPWLASSTSVWPDVPGAVLGLAAIAIMLFSTEGEEASWWILAAAPVALLAVLVRYGSLVPMGVGALAIMIWRRRTVAQSFRQFLALGTLIGVGSWMILFVPAVTGTSTSPFSSIRSLRDENPIALTRGLRDYVRQADFIVGGYAGLLLLIGLALSVLYAIRSERFRSEWRFVMATTIATAVVLTFILHGEYRYLSPVFPLAWIMAGWGLAETSRRLPREPALLIGLILVGLVPLNTIDHAGSQTELLSDRFEDLRVVSRAIDAAHGYEDCGIVTSYIPQVAWYTQCVTRRFEATPVLTTPFFDGDADYMILLTGGKRQPEGAALDSYLELTDGVFAESGNPEAGNLEYAVALVVATQP